MVDDWMILFLSRVLAGEKWGDLMAQTGEVCRTSDETSSGSVSEERPGEDELLWKNVWCSASYSTPRPHPDWRCWRWSESSHQHLIEMQWVLFKYFFGLNLTIVHLYLCLSPCICLLSSSCFHLTVSASLHLPLSLCVYLIYLYLNVSACISLPPSLHVSLCMSLCISISLYVCLYLPVPAVCVLLCIVCSPRLSLST